MSLLARWLKRIDCAYVVDICVGRDIVRGDHRLGDGHVFSGRIASGGCGRSHCGAANGGYAAPLIGPLR